MKKWLIQFMKPSLLLFAIPMLGGQCESETYYFEDQEFVWVRAYTTDEDAFTLARGTILSSTILDGKSLFFIRSWCDDYPNWPNTNPCLGSRLELILYQDVVYDVVGWSEPQDRTIPEREVTVFRTQWTCCKE